MHPQRAPSVSITHIKYLIYIQHLPRPELREAVAHLYNHTYRQGKTSQYTYENVCIVPGGRAGLSRVAAVVGDVYCVSRIVLNIHDNQ